VTVPRKLIEETRLDRILEVVVISRVDQPVDWCAPVVGTPKWNGKVRVFLNLSKLNELCQQGEPPTSICRLNSRKIGRFQSVFET